MGGRKNREREFERWPKYKALYLKAFEKMIENRGGTPAEYQNQTAEDIMTGYMTETWKSGGAVDFTQMTPEEIMKWWID